MILFFLNSDFVPKKVFSEHGFNETHSWNKILFFISMSCKEITSKFVQGTIT